MPEPRFEITGAVVDGDGRPIADARVSLVEGPVPVPDLAALTDGDGRFALSVPVTGTWVLAAAADSVDGTVKQTVTVHVDDTGARGAVDVRFDDPP